VTNDNSRRPRGEALWRVHKDGDLASCELREVAAGAGWELTLRIDNEITATRLYDSERIARHYADALRKDYLHDGWTE
jgi:hypothetical protein